MDFITTFLLSACVGTLILVVAIWLISDDSSSPFKQYGAAAAWARCAALAFGVGLLESFVPLLGMLAWFIGIMILFERTFVQAVVLTIAVWGISFLILMGLAGLLAGGASWAS